MSADILRTATHTERNGYTSHDRPSQACTYRSATHTIHQSATNAEHIRLIALPLHTQPAADGFTLGGVWRSMPALRHHCAISIQPCNALHAGTRCTERSEHTASQDNGRQVVRPHTFTAYISWLHVYSCTHAYSQNAANTQNTRLHITPGSLEITGFAAHKNSRRRKLNPVFVLEATKPVIARVSRTEYRCLFEEISRFTGCYITIFMQSCYNKSSVEARAKTEKTGQALQRQTGPPSHKATRLHV